MDFDLDLGMDLDLGIDLANDFANDLDFDLDLGIDLDLDRDLDLDLDRDRDRDLDPLPIGFAFSTQRPFVIITLRLFLGTHNDDSPQSKNTNASFVSFKSTFST